MSDLSALIVWHRKWFSVRATAKDIGISPTTLQKCLAGQYPDMTTLAKIMKWAGAKQLTIKLKDIEP